MAKSKAIPKATKFESGSTKASTKAGKVREVVSPMVHYLTLRLLGKGSDPRGGEMGE